MRLTCPHCGFSKELRSALLPEEATKANCPKCKQSFPLQTENQADQQQAASDLEPSIPAAMKIETQSGIEATPKAGFWLRVVAALIDAVIVLVLQLLLGSLLTLAGVATSGPSEGSIGTMAVLVQLFSFALSFAYYIVFTGHGGQTPGKMALRIKVVRCDGTDISYGRAAFREIPAKFISGIILCIGYLMVAFDDQKQGLHDRMADTYVIKL